jgi:hypothetical protein
MTMKSTPYGVVKDFSPVALVAKAPLSVAINKNLPITDIKSLIAYAKANPGNMSFAVGSIGSAGHLSTELLKRSTSDEEKVRIQTQLDQTRELLEKGNKEMGKFYRKPLHAWRMDLETIKLIKNGINNERYDGFDYNKFNRIKATSLILIDAIHVINRKRKSMPVKYSDEIIQKYYVLYKSKIKQIKGIPDVSVKLLRKVVKEEKANNNLRNQLSSFNHDEKEGTEIFKAKMLRDLLEMDNKLIEISGN